MSRYRWSISQRQHWKLVRAQRSFGNYPHRAYNGTNRSRAVRILESQYRLQFFVGIASVGQMNAHAPHPMHRSISISNGLETFRSTPRPLNPIAFAPTTSVHIRTHNPQSMHLSLPRQIEASRIPISSARFTSRGTRGILKEVSHNKPANLLHAFRVRLNAYSFLNREIACSYKLRPAAFFHLDVQSLHAP